MKAGDLIKRRWDVAKLGPMPSTYKVGVVVGKTPRSALTGGMILVQWCDGEWIGNACYHPDNLELVSESR